MNYQSIVLKVYKKVPASKTKRGIIQRASRHSNVINLARYLGLCKRRMKRHLNILYKQGKLDGY